MRLLFSILLLSCASTSFAVKVVRVDSGQIKTVRGVGGDVQIGYAFAKGDLVTIDADASRKLDRMLAYIYPQQMMGTVKLTKHVKYHFTMPEEGIVIFRFISDRGGTNKISYTVTRQPESDALQDYSTKVNWKAPNSIEGRLVPERAETAAYH